ncbi:MAG TPA: hypothetical protein VGN65_06450 [Casimicrobiaceae bacterium]
MKYQRVAARVQQLEERIVFLQVISLIGAALILIAFACSQAGKMDRQDFWYNLLNLFGSGLLAWVAIVNRQAGFIILETVWALLSIKPLFAGRTARV